MSSQKSSIPLPKCSTSVIDEPFTSFLLSFYRKIRSFPLCVAFLSSFCRRLQHDDLTTLVLSYFTSSFLSPPFFLLSHLGDFFLRTKNILSTTFFQLEMSSTDDSVLFLLGNASTFTFAKHH